MRFDIRSSGRADPLVRAGPPGPATLIIESKQSSDEAAGKPPRGHDCPPHNGRSSVGTGGAGFSLRGTSVPLSPTRIALRGGRAKARCRLKPAPQGSLSPLVAHSPLDTSLKRTRKEGRPGGRP